MRTQLVPAVLRPHRMYLPGYHYHFMPVWGTDFFVAARSIREVARILNRPFASIGLWRFVKRIDDNEFWPWWMKRPSKDEVPLWT